MISTSIQAAQSSIRSSKVRTALTTVGVIIGVIFFVLISSIVDGLNAGVRDQIESLGGNLITVTPGNTIERDEEGNIENFNFAASFGASTLTERDLQSVGEVDGIKAAAPQMIVSGIVSRDEMELSNGFILATNPSYPDAVNQSIETGSFFGSEAKSNVAVVGAGVVDELFAGTASLGSSITVRGQQFTIIGIMERYETNGFNFGPDINNAVYIPFETGKEFNGGVALVQEIDIQLEEEADADVVATAIEESILENHGGEKDFTVIKQDEFIDLTGNIFSLLKNFSNIISLIILMIGGVVILLVMLITVKERTQEIGLRKAVGATNRDILTQFIFEAIAVTWFGAFVGATISVAIGLLISALTELSPVFTLNTFLVAFALSSVFGLLGGIIPAFIAASKDPIEALRNE